MIKDYYIRSYLPGDEKEIVPLLKFAFDDWRLRGDNALDFWDWMYKGYNSNPSLIDVGVSDDRIIATNHRLPLRMKIGSKIVSGYYGTDMMVHPDFRGMGISSNIIKRVQEKMKNENLNFQYFYTDNPIMLKYNSKYYDLFPHTISRYLRIQDVGMHLKMKSTDKAWFLKLGYRLLKSINEIKNTKYLLNKQDCEIKEINRFDDRVNELWREVSKNLSFIIEKTKGYLNWRYCDPRPGQYIIKQAEDEETVLGYIVLKTVEKTEGYPEGYIVEILTLPNRLDVADALITEAVEHFDLNGVNSINGLVVKNHPYESIFQRHGFIDSRMKTYLFFHQQGIESETNKLALSLSDMIHLQHGDLFLI